MDDLILDPKFLKADEEASSADDTLHRLNPAWTGSNGSNGNF